MRGKARGKAAAEAYFQYVRVRLIPKQRSPAPKAFAKSLGGFVEKIPERRQILVLADFLESGDFLGEFVGVVLGGLDREAYAALVAVDFDDAGLDLSLIHI